MPYGNLLKSNETNELMLRHFQTSTKIEILTAFFTYPAFIWAEESCSRSKPKLVIRGLVNDFLSGASSIKAVIHAIESGWDISLLFPLHAKIYAFDDLIIVGSGNFTAKGLNLLNVSGNYELNVALKPTHATNEAIDQVFELSKKIDLKTATEMQYFLSEQIGKGNQDPACFWPSELLQLPTRPLLIADFPDEPLTSGTPPSNEPWATVFRKIRAEEYEVATKIVKQSASFAWLCETLKTRGNRLNFGGISSALHSDIVEDTRVYRQTVKETLVNFLSYLEHLPLSEIKFSRPKHTQILELNP